MLRYEITVLFGPCPEEEQEALMVRLADLPEVQAVGGAVSSRLDQGDARQITFNDRLTVTGHADSLLDMDAGRFTEIADALIRAVACCGEFPECSHVLAWSEAQGAAREPNSHPVPRQ